MTVNWLSFALVSGGLFALLGLTGLLRGTRAVIRMCCAIGVAVAVTGLLTGRVLVLAGGVIIVVAVCIAGGAR